MKISEVCSKYYSPDGDPFFVTKQTMGVFSTMSNICVLTVNYFRGKTPEMVEKDLNTILAVFLFSNLYVKDTFTFKA